MKHLFILFSLITTTLVAQPKEKVNQTLDAWHQAAAEANFEAYFNLMTKDAVFIGTDASENWKYQDFKDFSKPYFDKGKAWTFHPLERNVYFSEGIQIAWFDELLQTDLGLCRGSGVLKKTEEGWRVKHYVLSITIPNENVDAVKKQNEAHDDALIKLLK